MTIKDNKKEKEQETKEDANRIKLRHIKGIQNSELDFKLFFALIQNSVAFNLVYLILLFWELGRKKHTACRMQWLNHLEQQIIWQLQETWALQVVLSSSILPTYCCRLSLFGRSLSLYMVWCTFKHDWGSFLE